jgi:hypothetical protein
MGQRIVFNSDGDETGGRQLARVNNDPFTQLPLAVPAAFTKSCLEPDKVRHLSLHNRRRRQRTRVVELFDRSALAGSSSSEDSPKFAVARQPSKPDFCGLALSVRASKIRSNGLVAAGVWNGALNE